jgi:cyclopropane fatty-acyl-phospholipid synthase-like methyltransferase
MVLFVRAKSGDRVINLEIQHPPSSNVVTSSYDYLDAIAKCYGSTNLHYGYWSGTEDDTSIQAATDRLTSIVVERLRVGPGCRVLDLGCGNGRPAVAVARTTGAEVVGVDINQRALHTATEHARTEGMSELVAFRRCDARELPFPNGFFDAILLFESTPHFELSPLFREVARVLRPGGRAVAETPFMRVPMTNDIRRRVANFFEIFSVVSLETFDAHLQVARDVGLELEEFVDITRHASKTFERLANIIRQHRDNLAKEYGTTNIERLIQLFSEWAKTSEVGVMIMVMRKPDDVPLASS